MAEIRRSARKKRPLADITNTARPNASSISSSSSSNFLIKPTLPKKTKSNTSNLNITAAKPSTNFLNPTPKLPNPFSSSVNKSAHLAGSSGFMNNKAIEHSVYPHITRSGKDKKRIDQTVIPNPGSSASSAASILPPNASAPSQPSVRRLASVSTPALGTGDGGVSQRSGYTRMQTADRSYQGKEIVAPQPLSFSPATKIQNFWKETADAWSGKDKSHIAGGSTHIDWTVITNPCSSVPSSPQKLVSVTPAPGTDDFGVSPRSVYTLRRRSADRSYKGKEIAAAQPLGLSPARRSKRNDDEDITVPKSCTLPRKNLCLKADLSSDKRKRDGDIKSKSCIMPSTKKQRLIPDKKDDSEFSLPQHFVDQQTAYFTELDKFKLTVEEVASGDELD